MRQIFVSMDITAPLYWWKQFDKYQIGVTTNSESTMHTLIKEPITADDFSYESFEVPDYTSESYAYYAYSTGYIRCVANLCEELRQVYLATKDPRVWRLLIQVLPEGYNQRRTVTMNYENILTIVKQRSGHRLQEWQDFIDELKRLPYMTDFLGVDAQDG